MAKFGKMVHIADSHPVTPLPHFLRARGTAVPTASEFGLLITNCRFHQKVGLENGEIPRVM
jgi:hypothetical protein